MRHCNRIVLRVNSTRKREESTRLCVFGVYLTRMYRTASTRFAARKSYRAVCRIDTGLLTVFCDMVYSKRRGMTLFLIYNGMKKSYSIFTTYSCKSFAQSLFTHFRLHLTFNGVYFLQILIVKSCDSKIDYCCV
jgi:hypothetical protein